MNFNKVRILNQINTHKGRSGDILISPINKYKTTFHSKYTLYNPQFVLFFYPYYHSLL